MKLAQQCRMYLAGIFVSSTGSMTYGVATAAYLTKMGVSPIKLGILFAAIRINTVIVNAVLGHLGDFFSPRKIVLLSEICAALGSVAIYLSFRLTLQPGANPAEDQHWFWWFFAANQMRSFFTNLQAASIHKLAKIFDNALEQKGQMALRLNSVTFGSIVFGSITALLLIKVANYQTVMALDFITFLINGASLAILRIDDRPESTSIPTKFFRVNFHKYIELLPTLAVADALLSFAYAGQNTLNTRLMVNHFDFIPYMTGIFGAAVWISAYLLPKLKYRGFKYYWIVAAFGLGAQSLFIGQPPFIALAAIFSGVAYWLIYNTLGHQTMINTHVSQFATVSASRSALVVSVLSLGEIWVGLSLLQLHQEMLIRGAICLAAFAFFALGASLRKT